MLGGKLSRLALGLLQTRTGAPIDFEKAHVLFQDDPDAVSLQGGYDSDAAPAPEPEAGMASQIPQDKDNKGTQALEEALSGLPPRFVFCTLNNFCSWQVVHRCPNLMHLFLKKY